MGRRCTFILIFFDLPSHVTPDTYAILLELRRNPTNSFAKICIEQRCTPGTSLGADRAIARQSKIRLRDLGIGRATKFSRARRLGGSCSLSQWDFDVAADRGSRGSGEVDTGVEQAQIFQPGYAIEYDYISRLNCFRLL